MLFLSGFLVSLVVGTFYKLSEIVCCSNYCCSVAFVSYCLSLSFTICLRYINWCLLCLRVFCFLRGREMNWEGAWGRQKCTHFGPSHGCPQCFSELIFMAFTVHRGEQTNSGRGSDSNINGYPHPQDTLVIRGSQFGLVVRGVGSLCFSVRIVAEASWKLVCRWLVTHVGYCPRLLLLAGDVAAACCM